MDRKFKLRNTTTKFSVHLFIFLVSFVCFAGNLFAQTPEQIKFYSERIEFGTKEVKRNALHDLRNFRTALASQIALPALKDTSEIVRATATHSVIYLPKNESAKALLPLLNEKSEFIRRETVYALGKTHNPNVANQLIAMLQNDKKQSVKNAAAVSIGLVGSTVTIQPLTQILAKKPKKSKAFFRSSIARSIGQIAEHILKLELTKSTPKNFLPSKYKGIKKINFKFVDRFPVFKQAVPVLIKSLQTAKEHNNTKREAAFALGVIRDKSAIPVLRANLNNEDNYLAEICKEALEKMPD